MTRKRPGRLVHAACLLSLMAVTAASCQRAEPAPPNTLVLAVEAGPRLLDPRLYTDAAAAKAGDLLFNGLVQRNDDFSIAPDLAESWETPSPVKYVFHLRPGVVFHNGRPLTSADVKATVKYILDPANKSPRRSALLVIGSIETPDDLTVIFNLTEPSAPFLGELTLGIVPAGAGDETARAPVGTGPFRLSEYRIEEKIVFRRHERYHEGPPPLDGVIFKIIPDETVRVLELEKGGVDLVMNPITPDILPRLRENPDIKVVTRLGTNYSYLGFNLEDELTGDIAVRRAIAHAIDREGIIKYILKGLARPAAGPISKASAYYEPGLEKYGYAPAKARRILDDAGYEDPDGDGTAVRFTLKYSTSQNELRKLIAEAFQWQLGEVGIGLDIRSYEWGTFYADIKKGAFQVYSLTWVGMADPDILHYIFNSSSMPPNGANRGRYNNPRVDELTELGRTTFGSERREVYSEVQKILARELPYVSLWHSVNVAAMKNSVAGFALAPDENLKSLKHVVLREERTGK